MAKRSNRRAVRNEKEQLGCMWSLISMSDFRLGRSSQRLLSDIRRGNKYAGGVGNSGNKLDSSGDKCSRTHDGEEKTQATDACKPSVKKLIEEEMLVKQAERKELNNSAVEAKQFDSVQGTCYLKYHVRINPSNIKLQAILIWMV
ncbi:uncharacterized protein LOC120213626 [Hibiscus syriacus]|uniref:uncharacterized protein LOC120213626 n=1 Tax=Hibiscus syriacus TaxID=106335 RepID=UPI0019204612|nr:uncharacterized protein LOC120213626 [Hibiscus syriacus]